MAPLSMRLATLVLAFAKAAAGFDVTILADTNRDGKVDLTGSSDSLNKETWSNERGAVFLANIGDTKQRCSVKITDQTPTDELDKCNDASDNVQRNEKYLAPLRTLPIQKLSNRAVGSLTISDKTAAKKTRIFHKSGTKWVYVDDKYTFSATQLKKGLELGIDARDVRRPGPDGWNGKVNVKFSVTDGKQTSSDSVALRVAPVLTHHHLQVAQEMFVTSPGGDWDEPQTQLVKDVKEAAKWAGITTPVHQFKQGDQWAQDFFEPGYTSMPGPNGPIVLRIHIRSCQMGRDAGRQVFTQFRSDTVGAVQHAVTGESGDSLGNLETIPPYKHNGKEYPAGRNIMGNHVGEAPKMVEFLKAQETQDPLLLDTSWLSVGHVDEFIQFHPADSPRGWAIVVDDPMLAIDMFKKAQSDGFGKERWLSRKFSSDDTSNIFLASIDELLAVPNITEVNQDCHRRIEANLAILKAETGVTEEEIHRIPGIYFHEFADESPAFSFKQSSAKRRHAAKSNIIEAASSGKDAPPQYEKTLSTNPAMVNGVVFGNGKYLSVDPFGPKINGTDIFKQAGEDEYGSLNVTMRFIDDWFVLHQFHGEVHCGTNTAREANTPWWK